VYYFFLVLLIIPKFNLYIFQCLMYMSWKADWNRISNL